MAGKARYISSRNSPDPRFDQYLSNASAPISESLVASATRSNSTVNQYVRGRTAIISGYMGFFFHTTNISSGDLDISINSAPRTVPIKSYVECVAETGTTDVLDTITGRVIEGQILFLRASTLDTFTITHNSGSAGRILCPSNKDFTLKPSEIILLIDDPTTTPQAWRIVGGHEVFPALEVQSYESDEADMRLYRNDATPNDNNVLGNLIFSGNDSGGAKTDYAEISGVSEDVTDGTESGTMRIRVLKNGTMTSVFDIDGENQIIDVADTFDLKFSTSTGSMIGTASGQKIGFYGATPVIQRSAFTVTNHVTDRSYDANSTTVEELADVLGTLLTDLKSLGLFA